MIGVPFFFKWATDALNEQLQLPDLLSQFGIGVISLTIAYNVTRLLTIFLTQLRDILFAKVGQHAVRVLAYRAFSHIHKLSTQFHTEQKIGCLSRILERGIKCIETVVRVMTVYTIPTILEFLIGIAFLWYDYDYPYSSVTAITVILYIWFTIKASNWRIGHFREMNKSDVEANTKVVDSLINFETVKYFCAEQIETRNFDHSMSKYEETATRVASSLGWLNFGQGLIFSLGITLMLLMSVHAIQIGQQTVGDFVFMNALLTQLTVPLNIIGTMYRDTRQGLLEIEDLFHIMDEPLIIKDIPNAAPLKVKEGEICFKDVQFSYSPNYPTLKGISFKIPAGHTTALVGKSGAGKSTIAKLLYRFYDIQNGSISIDGQDIRSIAQESLRAAMGIIPQDTVLFNNTIAYNILYGRPDASDEDLRAAVEIAQLTSFINNLPHGYDTVVGERGLKLSGGEKQRIAIARTILKAPPLLIFDEATTALDSITERNIQKALDSRSKNRTTLIIAHRLSTIINASEIIVFHEGEIIERGSHTTLISHGKMYASMWTKQQAASKAEERLKKILVSE